jgi:hypothetical protein
VGPADVLAAARRVRQSGHAISALRVALELEARDSNGQPDESGVAEVLDALTASGKLWRTIATATWAGSSEPTTLIVFSLPRS